MNADNSNHLIVTVRKVADPSSFARFTWLFDEEGTAEVLFTGSVTEDDVNAMSQVTRAAEGNDHGAGWVTEVC